MSFEKHSNFNKQANFTEVKFGENKPVLEVELNELQQIQNEARADVVRDSIPSGFTQLGEIDYKYCLNNENKIKLKTDSVAYVNGYRINIPKDTIIDIGKAPEKDAREDLLFLEVWKEEVTSDSVLTVEGGEGQTEIPNSIKDSRYPIETTHRVALKWRIRHVADIDFDTLVLDGFNKADGSMDGDNSKGLTLGVVAQGGNTEPINPSTLVSSKLRLTWGFKSSTKYIIENYRNFNDTGLYFAGFVDDINFSKQQLKTADGYVYAIPMFRLYRKPSCGKSIPFEYSKINPKVDYSKFTKLVQDEKVERVVTENIQGRSLVNYCDSINTRSSFFVPISDNYISVNNPTDAGDIRFNVPLLKAGTSYTLIVEVAENNLEINLHADLFPDTFEEILNISKGYTGILKKVFIMPSDISTLESLRYYVHSSGKGVAKVRCPMILEGDWTNKEIPNFFTGLKSLGEDDGNLITLKTGILSDDTYDINDGNQKLNTFSEVTHILSENTIIPKVGAVVKKGEQETLLEKLGTKLDTDGTEIVEFTKIEGKTLQNLIPKFNIAGSLPNGVCDEIVGNRIIRRVGKITLDGSENWTESQDYVYTKCIRFNLVLPTIKPGINNKLYCDKFRYLYIHHLVANDPLRDREGITPHTKEKELNITILKSKLSTLNLSGFKSWLSQNPTTVYYELANPIEEYLENVYDKESIKTYQLDAPLRSLPNGVKDEIKDGVLIRRCGEAIFDGSDDEGWTALDSTNPKDNHLILCKISPKDSKANHEAPTGILVNNITSKYTWHIDAEGVWIDGNGNTYVSVAKTKLTSINKLGFTTWLSKNPIKIVYELATPIEIPLTEVKPQTANFSLQRQFGEGNWLRELPNGVKDTIENGKVIRRIKRVVLTGEEVWNRAPFADGTTSFAVIINNFSSSTKVKSILSDKLTVLNTYTLDTQGIYLDNNLIIKLPKATITSLELAKQWLQSNPVTLLYELANSTEEDLSIDNYMTYPCHDFNTYCGSMYVGEGRNYIINDNKLPSENPVIIETDFREIEGNIRVEDCKYKKNDDGYNTPYISSSSKNLLDISTSNIITKDYSKYYRFNYTELNNGFTISNNIANSFASIRFRVYLKAGVSYRIEYAQTGPYSFVDLKTLNLELFICNLNSNSVFKVTNTGYYSVNFYCTSSVSTISTATFTDIRITEGETSVPFEPCNKTTKYLENTEENDIEDLRHLVSLTGFNYDKVLNESFDKLLNGTL